MPIMDLSSSKYSPAIDIETVHYIAKLIRLKVNDEEAKVLSDQFSQIIDYFEILTDIDTSEIQPANEKAYLNNIFRDDVIRPSMSRDEFLKNTPHHEGNFVRIPRVFDDR